ncbi:MAG: hypothetical protein ABJN39_20250 [Sulfitobacter sp.]|uniref:hypothetical protein n=1 Tax=Sulfitobacter sp. TaxID=1903071 RepID=UPI00329985E3
MKFDPFKWQQVRPNVENKGPQGMLHVMCSESATVYVSCQGVEAIAGHGKEVRVRLAEAFTFRVKADKAADVFVYSPMANCQQSDGEVFTNIDRQPDESGTMLEISRALRAFKLEQAGLRKQVRAEMRELQKERKVRNPVTPDSDDDPESSDIEDAQTEGDEPEETGEQPE